MSLPYTAFKRALEKAKSKSKKRKFTQSIEFIAKIRDIDFKKPENRVNMIIALPHPPRNKKVKICVIATGDLALKAKNLGVDLVIDRDDLEELATNKKKARKLSKQYDFFLAQADMMPLVGRVLGRYLGPKGKMPTPITLGTNIAGVIERMRKSIRIRIRNQPQLMCKIGDENQSDKEIIENIETVVDSLGGKIKFPQNYEKIYIKLTMGPAIRVNIGEKK